MSEAETRPRISNRLHATRLGHRYHATIRRASEWQISAGIHAIWSNNGRELFYETADNRIMVVDYSVNGDSFVPGKPHLWSDKQIYNGGVTNWALAPDGKRFAVFLPQEVTSREQNTLRVTFLLNFLDELRRRIL